MTVEAPGHPIYEHNGGMSVFHFLVTDLELNTLVKTIESHGLEVQIARSLVIDDQIQNKTILDG